MPLRLKEVLKQNSVSARDLSQKMSLNGTPLSPVSISRIITGETSPRASTLEDIARALNISVIELFEMEGYESTFVKDSEGNDKHVGFRKV